MTAPVATAATASSISAAFSSALRVRVVGDHRRDPGRDRARRRRPARASAACSAACSAAEDHVRVVRQHDHLRRRRSPRSPRGCRRSTGSSTGRPRRSASRRGCGRAARSRPRRRPRRPRTPAARREPAGASRARSVWRCMFAISIPSSTPRAAPSAERGAGIVGVDVHLQRGLVADDHQRVAELLELAPRARGVEPLALDDEDGAVAVAGELLVDRVDADVLEPGRKRAAAPRRSPPRSGRGRARASPAPPASTTPASRRISRYCGVRASASSPRRTSARSRSRDGQVGRRPRLRLLGELADHRQHRPLDRLAHRAVGGVARRAERPRERRRVDRLRLRRSPRRTRGRSGRGSRPSSRARPSAPRVRSRARAARGRARRASRAPPSPRGRSAQVRPGVAVRDWIDVQVVDPLAARLQRGGRGARRGGERPPDRSCVRPSRPRCAPRRRRR